MVVAAYGGPPIIEHGKTGMLLVLVAGGAFLVGDEKFPVELPAYYIGMHAVTNGQYGEFVGEAKHRVPDNQIWQEVGKADHPVTDVSWEDAKAYCAWAGLRLPSELEWEKAARWVDGREFPWGEQWNETKCRNARNTGGETTADVWSYAEGVSPNGAYQMSGNVWEWCEVKADNQYQQGQRAPVGMGAYRMLRGGSLVNDDPDDFTAYRHLDRPASLRYVGFGFRCACGFARW